MNILLEYEVQYNIFLSYGEWVWVSPGLKSLFGSITNMIVYLCIVKPLNVMKLKKTFYLLREKSFVNDNVLDVGVFIEKIVLTTESEDFKEFTKSCIQRSTEEMFEVYIDNFRFYFKDELENESVEDEQFMVYNNILLDEDQYKMLMKQTEDIPLREVLVNELG